MTLKDMYKGQVNSPETKIASAINTTVTSITVEDGNILPLPPNLLVLGGDTDNPETVKMTNKVGNVLTVERAFQGEAQNWAKDTVIGRNFTEYDYNTLIDNIDDLDSTKLDTSNFVDTVTTINNKTGVIKKSDIVALGIPAQDTVYDDSGNLFRGHSLGDEVEPLPAIDADLLAGQPPSYYLTGGSGEGGGLTEEEIKLIKVNNAVNADTVNGKTVGINVPTNAIFTDTNTVTSINGKTGVIAKADIVALGIPASDTNTTYTAGTNIQINGTTISATDTNTTYTAGTNVTISGTTINATDSKREDSTSEFRLEVRTSDPASPAIGRMWYRSDL